MLKRTSSIAAALLALGTVCAGAAHASNVQWSVGINLPAVGTVITNAPVYYPPAPVYYPPAPVYVQPAPVVVYRPAPVVVYRPAPPPVYRPLPVYAPRYYGGPGVVRTGWAVPPRGDRYDGRHDQRHDHRDSHRDDRKDDRRKHH